MALVEFKDLPDTTTPITASNLNNNFEYLDNQIQDIYSTNEIKTNKIWKNGKPIYRKYFEWNNFTAEGNATYNYNIQNIDELTDYDLKLDNNGQLIKYPTTTWDGKVLGVRVSSSQIAWYGNDSWTASENRTHRFVVEYTKTTD